MKENLKESERVRVVGHTSPEKHLKYSGPNLKIALIFMIVIEEPTNVARRQDG